MIELIFAIVIIAISVMSLPMMAQINQKGIEQGILQEAIFAASAELMGASAGYWDENSMADIDFSHISRVIDISNDCNATTKLRPGHINQPFHRICLDDLTTGATSAKGSAFFTLNDANKTQDDLFENSGAGTATADATGYKQLYESTLSVTPDTTDVNIKLLEVNVYEDGGSVVIINLKMQSANIGEIDYYKRTMP